MNLKKGLFRTAVVVSIACFVCWLLWGLYCWGIGDCVEWHEEFNYCTKKIHSVDHIGAGCIFGGLNVAGVWIVYCFLRWVCIPSLTWIIKGYGFLPDEAKILTNTEIEEYRNKLSEIVQMPDSGNKKKIPGLDTEYDTGQYKRFLKLRELALKIGASHISTERQKTANEGELVYAINMALQSATMINMSKTASRNFWIAVSAMMAAVISAIAAWAAIVRN